MRHFSALAKDPTVLLLHLLVFAVPLVFAGPPSQRTFQLAAYCLLSFLLLATFLLTGGTRLDRDPFYRLMVAGPNLPIAAFVASALLSLALSINVFYSQFAAVQVLTGALAYGIIVSRFRQPGQALTLLGSLAVLGGLVVFAALLLDAGKTGLQLAGPFHDRQLLGAFLCLLLPLIAGLAAGTQHRGGQMGAQLAAILIAGALLLTGCRSSWLGAAAGMTVFAALAVKFAWKRAKWREQKHFLIATPLLAGVSLAVMLAYSGMAGAILARASTLTAVHADDSVLDRLNLWRAGAQLLGERPAAGWGIGTYALAQATQNPEARSLEEILRTGPVLYENPHNLYLQIGAEQGLTGLVAFLAILTAYFRYGYRALSRTRPGLRQYVLIGCLASIAGQSVDGLANPGWRFPELALFLWIVLGLGMRAAGLPRHAEATEAAAPTASPDAASGQGFARGTRLVITGVALGLIALHLVGLNRTAAAAARSPGRVPGVGLPGTTLSPGGPPPAQPSPAPQHLYRSGTRARGRSLEREEVRKSSQAALAAVSRIDAELLALYHGAKNNKRSPTRWR